MTTNEKLYDILSQSANRQDPAVVKALEALKENIREEAIKRAGSAKKPAAIVKRMMTANKRDGRPMLQGFHPYGGLKAFTDGYRILASADAFGYDEVKEPHRIQVDKLIPNVSAFDAAVTITDDIIADLKTFAKLHKKDRKPYIMITSDGFRMGFNPIYLIDAVEFTGCRVLHFNKKGESLESPAAIYTDSSVALLLPVHIGSDNVANVGV